VPIEIADPVILRQWLRRSGAAATDRGSTRQRGDDALRV
jgi:hypothetical protein